VLVALLWTTQAALARRPEVPAGQVEANIGRMLGVLSNVALRAKIARFTGAGKGHQVDILEADISIADGVEQYSEVRGNNRIYRQISEVGGLLAFGEVVTMLHTTGEMIDSPDTTWQKVPDGDVIRFHGAPADRRWFIASEGRVFWLGFDGAVRISSETGQIESLIWTTSGRAGPGGVDSIVWEVHFHAVPVAGEAEIVPSESLYRVVRSGRSRKAEWNLTRYTPVGRFGSRSTVSFDGE
jgi:hypothetical protein